MNEYRHRERLFQTLNAATLFDLMGGDVSHAFAGPQIFDPWKR